MAGYEDIALAIKQRDLDSIIRLMFEGNPPSIRPGFRTETELWDYKSDCPKLSKENINAWAEIAFDILGFYNHRGGIIIFGIKDDYSFVGASTRLDSKLFNDQIRKFLSDKIWVEYSREFIQPDQTYLGIALVPERGPIIERFRNDAPIIKGHHLFKARDASIRENDSTKILPKAKADIFAHKVAIPTIGKLYEVDDVFYRILAPEYTNFVIRDEPCASVESGLGDPRTAVTSITGIGGVGKTALATWAVLRAYERKDFEFIVSITAKDRELTSTGIQALTPKLTSYESLLDSIFEVLRFPEFKSFALKRKESEAHTLLEESNGLLYVDNIETVDDPRIIWFLDNLPIGVRAIVTSRRSKVRTSVFPVDLTPLKDHEIAKFVTSLLDEKGLSYVKQLSSEEKMIIGNACDGIPLAIRWVLSRAGSLEEAIHLAEGLTEYNKKGEELLEFCFRRIFDEMTNTEKSILQVLSLFQKPLQAEAVIVGAKLTPHLIQDSIEKLIEDSILQRYFDTSRNDYSYNLMPIVRAFVYSQVKKSDKLEENIRKNLTDWFEAKDISDSEERVVVREIRQGKEASELALLDLAVSAQSRGDLKSAESLYKQALSRNTKNWQVAVKYAEFLRHIRKDVAGAIQYYEMAASHAPRRGQERARIFREWGMLLRDCGEPDATDLAIEKFEIALLESPTDEVAIHALAHMLHRKGFNTRVVELLEPLAKHYRANTRKKALSLLKDAYECLRDPLNVSRIKVELERLELDNSQ